MAIHILPPSRIILPCVCLCVCVCAWGWGGGLHVHGGGLSVFVSVCLSLFLSVFVSVFVSVRLSACLPACLSVCLCVCVCLSVCLSLVPSPLSLCQIASSCIDDAGNTGSILSFVLTGRLYLYPSLAERSIDTFYTTDVCVVKPAIGGHAIEKQR